MREAIGGSSLLYLVIIFITVVMLLFVGILSYSKAYKIKNRIIEIVEKYGNHNDDAINEINPYLAASGYNASEPTRCDSIKTRLTNDKYNEDELSNNRNSSGYNYCVFEICKQWESDEKLQCGDSNGHYYVVVSFIHFQVPVIGDILTFPVYGETKILGRTYDY